jgi:hypothetical protein
MSIFQLHMDSIVLIFSVTSCLFYSDDDPTPHGCSGRWRFMMRGAPSLSLSSLYQFVAHTLCMLYMLNYQQWTMICMWLVYGLCMCLVFEHMWCTMWKFMIIVNCMLSMMEYVNLDDICELMMWCISFDVYEIYTHFKLFWNKRMYKNKKCTYTQTLVETSWYKFKL